MGLYNVGIAPLANNAFGKVPLSKITSSPVSALVAIHKKGIGN